jgi:cobalt/nickel transport system permease protein
MIPEWMKEVKSEPKEFPPASRGRGNFIKKTLDGILAFFQEAFISEEFSRRHGLLQSLDPRMKLISALALVFSLSLTEDLRVLLAVYLIILALAHFSRIEVVFFLKRVWLFIPLFTGVIAIPMILNIFFPGKPLYPLVGPGLLGLPLPEIYITEEGLKAAVVFTLRVAASVSAVVLMFLTTPQQLLFKSLRSVGVPKVYVLTLGMAYRYIFLFMETIKGLYTAKKSRTIKGGGIMAEQRWVGGRIGYMLIKSLDMSEKVHMAMISRGFNGEVKIMEESKMKSLDYLAGFCAVSFSLILALISIKAIQI